MRAWIETLYAVAKLLNVNVARTLGCERGLKHIKASGERERRKVARTLGCERGLKHTLRGTYKTDADSRSHPRVRAWIETKYATLHPKRRRVARTLGCERGLKPHIDGAESAPMPVARTLGCERGLKLADEARGIANRASLAPSGASVD